MTEKGKYRIAGALAGTVNGLFGGGGGVPLVFLLRTWANVPDKTALATCVAVIFPFCLASLLVYALCGALPLKEALPYLFGGLVGGWTGGEADRLLTVNCPEALLARLPEGKRAAALGVLANDPRPHYQNDPERVYGLAFAGFELRFRVEGDALTVTGIRPSSGKESL